MDLDIYLLSIEHVIAYRVGKSHASLPAPNDVPGKSIMSVIFTALIFTGTFWVAVLVVECLRLMCAFGD